MPLRTLGAQAAAGLPSEISAGARILKKHKAGMTCAEFMRAMDSRHDKGVVARIVLGALYHSGHARVVRRGGACVWLHRSNGQRKWDSAVLLYDRAQIAAALNVSSSSIGAWQGTSSLQAFGAKSVGGFYFDPYEVAAWCSKNRGSRKSPDTRLAFDRFQKQFGVAPLVLPEQKPAEAATEAALGFSEQTTAVATEAAMIASASYTVSDSPAPLPDPLKGLREMFAETAAAISRSSTVCEACAGLKKGLSDAKEEIRVTEQLYGEEIEGLKLAIAKTNGKLDRAVEERNAARAELVTTQKNLTRIQASAASRERDAAAAGAREVLLNIQDLLTNGTSLDVDAAIQHAEKILAEIKKEERE